LALGIPTVAELNERIDSRELSEWIAYYNIEPFGQDRMELMLAQLTAVLANANRGKKGRPFRVGDFLIGYEAEPPSFEQIVSSLKGASRGNERRKT